MAPAQRVVRQRKLNKATLQTVLREAQIESAEYESTQNQYQVQTGVEAAEENVCISRDINHVTLFFVYHVVTLIRLLPCLPFFFL